MKSALFTTILIPILTVSLSVKSFADEIFLPSNRQTGIANTTAVTPSLAATSAVTAQSPAFPTQIAPNAQENREGGDTRMTNAQQQLITTPPSGSFPTTTHGQQTTGQGAEQQMGMTTTQAASQIIAPIAPSDVRLLRVARRFFLHRLTTIFA